MTECDHPELTFSCDLCRWFRGGYPASLDSTLIIINECNGRTTVSERGGRAAGERRREAASGNGPPYFSAQLNRRSARPPG
jgi:hypothetical protein